MVATIITLLTQDEEVALAGRIAAGKLGGRKLTADALAARNEMVNRNRRLVVEIAKDYSDRGMEFEDIIQEGSIGLIRAAEDFRVTFGTRFGTYASYWIKQAIRAAFVNKVNLIYLPAHIIKILRQWRNTEARMLASGIPPRPEAVAALIGLSPEQADLARKAIKATKVLDTTGDTYCHQSPDQATIDAEAREKIRQIVASLPEPSRTVIVRRFGLDEQKPQTLAAIGQELGYTREGIRQIEIRSLARLQEEYV